MVASQTREENSETESLISRQQELEMFPQAPAAFLGIKPTTLISRIEKMGLKPPHLDL
jgi:hypothetical protein